MNQYSYAANSTHGEHLYPAKKSVIGKTYRKKKGDDATIVIPWPEEIKIVSNGEDKLVTCEVLMPSIHNAIGLDFRLIDYTAILTYYEPL